MSCSIVAIGTEITSGEVLNRNASRLAELLEDLGFEVVLHLAVPDDRPLIKAALAFAGAHSNYIFTTGGLGPTTDDFTREVISDHTGLPLDFDQQMWSRLESVLKDRGLRVRDEHRQQCFFPRGSQIIENSYGTAHGFICAHASQKVIVLPGPPKEIQSIWENGLRDELTAGGQGQSRLHLKTWCVVGQPESEVAAVVEEVFAGSGLQLGYRASLPYVYVKVWVPEARLKQSHSLLERLESALSQWWLIPADEDPAEKLLSQLSGQAAWVVADNASGGFLSARLGAALSRTTRPLHLEFVSRVGVPQPEKLNDHSRVPQLERHNDSRHHLWIDDGKDAWSLGLSRAGRVLQKEVPVPLRLKADDERARLYISEMALLYWLELLNTSS